ncbi:MAG: response regulator [Candidatus Promineifilaceae bacterium]
MSKQAIDILLVEDNEDDIILTLESFHEIKTAVITHVVRNGEEAISFLRRTGAYANVPTPSLIVMDINMPKMNGFEVLDNIKQDPMLCQIPVVILTTSDRREDINRAYRLGASSYIPKPVGFDNFVLVAQQFSAYWSEVSRVPAGK